MSLRHFSTTKQCFETRNLSPSRQETCLRDKFVVSRDENNTSLRSVLLSLRQAFVSEKFSVSVNVDILIAAETICPKHCLTDMHAYRPWTWMVARGPCPGPLLHLCSFVLFVIRHFIFSYIMRNIGEIRKTNHAMQLAMVMQQMVGTLQNAVYVGECS